MTKPTPLLALNWKMNKTPSEARAWAAELAERFAGEAAELAVMAPAIDLPGVADALRGSRVAYGAQDVSAFESGAYTGEISAAMLRDVGATYAIVGHSERRAYHAETDEKVAAKTRAAMHAGLVPIVCVGEELPVREAGEHVAFTLTSLRGSLADVNVEDASALVIAYEPVWAIGTGKTATAGDAEEMAAAIRGELRTLLGDVADGVRVLYGGSVKPGNIAEMCGKANVNGALVGGASLELDSVLGMAGALGV